MSENTSNEKTSDNIQNINKVSESPKPITVGVIGGGQLAAMMTTAATEMGISTYALVENNDSPATHSASFYEIGDYTDEKTLNDFAQKLHAPITFDHEHVPSPLLSSLEEQGIVFHPSSEALQYAQNKILMRQKMEELDLPNPAWAAVEDNEDVKKFAETYPYPLVLKTAQGGYDGKGVALVKDEDDLKNYDSWFSIDSTQDAHKKTKEQLLIEEYIPFTREISALAARTPSADYAAWDLVETRQYDGICDVVISPAPALENDLSQKISQATQKIAKNLDITGVFAVEIFVIESPDNTSEFFINELAMRPHNSGHWTQDGSRTSQFEQHLRAVADIKLGSTASTAPQTIMKNLLGQHETSQVPNSHAHYDRVFQDNPDIKIHWYSKSPRPLRKLGHLNMSFKDSQSLENKLVILKNAAKIILEE